MGGLVQYLGGWGGVMSVCVMSLYSLCWWQVQISVYCARRIPAHLRCTQCSIMLHLSRPHCWGWEGSTQFAQGLPDRCHSSTACGLCRLGPILMISACVFVNKQFELLEFVFYSVYVDLQYGEISLTFTAGYVSLCCVCSHVVIWSVCEVVVVPYVDAMVAVTDACTVVVLHVCMRAGEGARLTAMLVWGIDEAWL